MPSRGWRRVRRRGTWQAHRSPRGADGHPRAGCAQRGRRHSHRAAGRDTAAGVRRAGTATPAWPRCVPRARPRPGLRVDLQVGARTRPTVARAGSGEQSVDDRALGQARAGDDRVARGHAGRGVRVAARAADATPASRRGLGHRCRGGVPARLGCPPARDRRWQPLERSGHRSPAAGAARCAVGDRLSPSGPDRPPAALVRGFTGPWRRSRVGGACCGGRSGACRRRPARRPHHRRLHPVPTTGSRAAAGARAPRTSRAGPRVPAHDLDRGRAGSVPARAAADRRRSGTLGLDGRCPCRLRGLERYRERARRSRSRHARGAAR